MCYSDWLSLGSVARRVEIYQKKGGGVLGYPQTLASQNKNWVHMEKEISRLLKLGVSCHTESNWKNQICWLECSEPYKFLIVERIQRNVCKANPATQQILYLWFTIGPELYFSFSSAFPPLPVSTVATYCVSHIAFSQTHHVLYFYASISFQMLSLLLDLLFLSYLSVKLLISQGPSPKVHLLRSFLRNWLYHLEFFDTIRK